MEDVTNSSGGGFIWIDEDVLSGESGSYMADQVTCAANQQCFRGK